MKARTKRGAEESRSRAVENVLAILRLRLRLGLGLAGRNIK